LVGDMRRDSSASEHSMNIACIRDAPSTIGDLHNSLLVDESVRSEGSQAGA
jgi:hypothetical protein